MHIGPIHSHLRIDFFTSVDGRIMVNRSIELDEPIIFVGLNHRQVSYLVSASAH